MPIAALSENAARAICSSLVLNDATSVVKELVDNALDSNASSIIIEISANTLDTIQVKDNGAGIGIEDRQLLCKRGFTSKIRTFDDLTQLGGKFLGFRGEALASIAELSEHLILTTRIDGENVGTLLKFDSQGKLISSSSAAHGTGTTVKVSDFLKSIPVRRQTALKHTAKSLSSIKRLLFDYAFARPTVRFQFKVLKSGSELKANWSFAPCIDASNLGLVASKIVGKEIAAQCQQATVTSDDGSNTIDALLYAKDADISKCSGTDRFVSIDGRPLTVERGLMKEMNRTYKSYIAGTLSDATKLPTKIFLLLRLRCPRGSYDVNVEPAKNEVMFEDSHQIMNLFEQLCENAYGEKSMQPSRAKEASKRPEEHPTDFNVLLAHKTHPLVANNVDQQIGLEQSDHEEPDAIEDVMDSQVTNPFTLAKINTRVRPQQISSPLDEAMRHRNPPSDVEVLLSAPEGKSIMLPSPSPSPTRQEPYQNPGPPNRPWKRRQIQQDEENNDNEILSPSLTQQIAPPDKPTLIEQWTKSVNTRVVPNPQTSILSPTRSTVSSVPNYTPTKGLASGLSKIQTPFRTPFKNNSSSHADSMDSGGPPASRTIIRNVSASDSNSGSPVEIETPKLLGFSRPTMPINTELEDIMDFEHRKRSTILQHRDKFKQQKPCRTTKGDEREGTMKLFTVPTRPENEGMNPAASETDYKSRFEGDIGDETVGVPPQPNSASYTQNPHWNRYKKAIRDLDERASQPTAANRGQVIVNTDEDGEELLSTSLEPEHQRSQKASLSPEDPRAYLIRHSQRDQGEKSGKPKRSVTAKFPFETIKPELATFTCLGILKPGITDNSSQQISKQARALGLIDAYVREGSICSDLKGGKISEDVVHMWEAQLRRLSRADIAQSKAPE